MGEFCLGTQDFLFERENPDETPKFVLETLERQNPDPANIALQNTLKELLAHNNIIKGRQDFLDDMVFDLSGTKLPADATPIQRAEAMKQVLDNKNTKLRFVFFSWPEDLNANSEDPPPPPDKDIRPKKSLTGKTAPNGNRFWGASLFDFYFVPKSYNLQSSSISTGSRLANWAKANGEANGPAKDVIEWAETAEDPKLLPPYDIQLLIGDMEEAIRQHIIASQMDEEQKDQQEEVQPDRWKFPEQWPPKSVFAPEAYPKGWATDAFADYKVYGFDATPILQHYIPQHRLPEKLVVHDPSNLLNCMLCSMPESVDAERKVNYNLKLSEVYADRRKADAEREAEEAAHAKQTLELFLANPHSSLERPNGIEIVDLKEPGWTKPAIFVVFPHRPPLKRPDEVHLYLSPRHLIGKGNHSRVYSTEMVVPRSWLMHEVMCMECVKGDVEKILEEEDGLHGERRLQKWDEKTGMVVRHEFRKRPHHAVRDLGDIGTTKYRIREAVTQDTMAYEGPYRVVHTRVKYQSLERGPLCVHLSKEMAQLHPLATKVHLAAKLTVNQDLSMHQQEAENYQRFPKHFFEHWSGFNLFPPQPEPVPVGPLVPQFYGYYVPEEKSDIYQSPILLIEQCGKQIGSKELSVDDMKECLSLGLRMNAAGWYHGSFFERNVLKQAGPLNISPESRKENTTRRNGYGVDWSFRLIDFGRSRFPGGSYEYGQRLKEETSNIRRWWTQGITSSFIGWYGH